MSIPEAIKGARAELAAITSWPQKVSRILTYARIISMELFSTLTIAPYGIRARTLHLSLPSYTAPRAGVVSVVKNIPYCSSHPRTTMDIYLPPSNVPPPSDDTKNDTTTTNTKSPVALFVHGGVWSTGETWHYAPMAVRLAQAGIVTAVMSYTLYPEALAPDMAVQVSTALSWTMKNVGRFGGDAEDVTLAGHSAGAQLCAMALIHRLASLSLSGNGHGDEDGTATQTDSYTKRMPKRFVGVAGVYDIEKHFEYEEARDVHTLSTMARAVGGRRGFAANSPLLILRAAMRGEVSSRGGTLETHAPSVAVFEQTQNSRTTTATTATSIKKKTFFGDAIATRIGLNRVDDPESTADPNGVCTAAIPIPIHMNQLAKWPPTVLQASVGDVTVPWYESSDFHWALHDCHIPVKTLIYGNKVGHGDFVVDWPSNGGDGDRHYRLPDHAVDFINIIRDPEHTIMYTKKQ